jgi:hypothetical protein
MSGQFEIPGYVFRDMIRMHRKTLAAAALKGKGGKASADAAAPIQDLTMLNVVERPALAKGARITSSVEVVTPSAARCLRDTAHFARQRNISPFNVDRLASEMARGQFTPGTQIYICVLPSGAELIVNGNHTLEAIYKSGVPQVLTVTRKVVADEDEAGRIYAVFDIQKIRTWGDSLKATGAGEDIPLAQYILAALGVIDARFALSRPTSVSRLDRIAKLEEYREPAMMLAAAMNGSPTHTQRLVRRAGVLAVALETFRYQPSFAAEFWFRVAQDDGLSGAMPERALLSWLRNVKTANGLIGQREHCKASAAAWNAAFRGEERTYVKPNAMVTFFLLGTPWANGVPDGGE